MSRLAVAASIIVALIAGLGVGSLLLPANTSTALASGKLYEVEFTQQGVCSPQVWVAPWAVVLDSQTIVRPPNATLPLSENSYGASPSYGNYSAIWFSVRNGTYSYTVLPKVALDQSGNLTIAGKDSVVEVHAAPIGCTTTTQVST
jgi:hypothetical protein